MHRSLVAAVAAICLVTACAQPGAVYQTPLAEARQTLVETGLPPFVFGSQAPSFDVRDGGSEVVWTVRRQNVELFHYVAHLTQEGSGATRVTVELKGAQSGPGGNIEQRLAEHPEIRGMYLVAINERIASALEHRDFNLGRVYPAMTAAAIANIGALSASFDAASAAYHRNARENIEKAYRDEAAGR